MSRRQATLSASGRIVAVRGAAGTTTIEIQLEAPSELAHRHAWPGRRVLALLELLPDRYPERT